MAKREANEMFVEERENINRPMFRLFSVYGRRYPVPVLTALLANLIAPLLGLVPTYLLALAIDSLFDQTRPFALPLVPQRFIPATSGGQLVFAFALMVVVYCLTSLTTWAGSWGWAVFAENVQHALRTDAYDKMQELGMEFFSDKQTGELMSILASDVNRLEGFLNGWVGRLLNIGMQVVGITIVMFTVNWQLALVALLPTPLLTVISYLFVRRLHPMYREARGTFGELASRLENNLSGIAVVKSFTTEPFESERVVSSSRALRDARLGARRLGIRFGPTLTLINGLGFALVFIIGGMWVTDNWQFVGGHPSFFSGALSVGVLVMFLQYTRQIQGPMSQAGMLLNNYERVKASAERVFVLFDYPTNIPQRGDAVDLGSVRGRVEFDRVSFSYPDGERAITDVSFRAEPGTTVGLVGPTGSGKSTLMKLLMRFYDVDGTNERTNGSASNFRRSNGGAVRVDGHDVRDVTLRSLRTAVGYVSQEPFLFTGTIRENIAYGMDAREDEILAASKRANAHDFITDLEDGYDTEVGQRGDRLSGGQRQRIAIARTILKDPDVIVLDEATSHVDNETEVLIQRSLDELIEGRTTFAIAHRLSTVRNADTILVLEDGEIVERGTHESLLSENGLYANLWRVQIGEIEALPESFLAEAAARDRD